MGSLLCECYAPGNHEDIKCLKQKGVNMLEVKQSEEDVLAITRLQSKKAMYLDPCMEKERLQEARVDIERAMAKEWKASH